MARQKEGRLQRSIRSALEFYFPGAVFTKIHGGEFQEPGIGDLMGCVHGLHIELEVKTDTGRPRPTQLLRQRRIRKAKGLYEFVRSEQEAVDVVRKWIRATLKNQTQTISDKSDEQVVPRRARRVVHGSSDGKEPFHIVRPGKVVARKIP